jgi:hypothetical protein
MPNESVVMRDWEWRPEDVYFRYVPRAAFLPGLDAALDLFARCYLLERRAESPSTMSCSKPSRGDLRR